MRWSDTYRNTRTRAHYDFRKKEKCDIVFHTPKKPIYKIELVTRNSSIVKY